MSVYVIDSLYFDSDCRWRNYTAAFLKPLLHDDSFIKITSPIGKEARKVAVDLLEWCTSDIYKQHFETFIKNT